MNRLRSKLPESDGQCSPTHAHALAFAAAEPGAISYGAPVSTGLARLKMYHFGNVVMRILLNGDAFSVSSVCACMSKPFDAHW